MNHDPAVPPAGAWPADLARRALEQMPWPCLVLDQQLTIRYHNPVAQQLLAGSASGASFVALLERSSQAKALTWLQRALNTPSVAPAELHQPTADGAIITVAYYVTRLNTPDAASLLLLTGQPLTDTVAATQRLINLNRRLSVLLSTSTVAARALALDELLDHTLQAILDELQLPAGAILLPVTDANAALRLSAQRGFAPAAEPRLNTLPQHLLAEPAPPTARQTVVRTPLDGELPLTEADVPAARGPWLALAATPLRDDERSLGWLITTSDRYHVLEGLRDLLDDLGGLLGRAIHKARLYEELRTTSARLITVLEAIDSGVLLVARDGTVQYANQQLGRLLQRDISAWPGQPRAAVMPALQVYDATPSMGELWTLPESGRVLRRYSAPIHDRYGTPLGSIETYSDVTASVEMDRLRDEFVSAAAHDLKTPVTAVKGYAQIARRMARRYDDQRLDHQLAMIEARSDELARLMNSLLDVSRLRGRRLQLSPETTTLATVVTRAVRHFEFDLHRRRRTLTLDLPDEPVEVVWDAPRIELVLTNLIDNALKYSPGGEPVELRARATGEPTPGVHLTVTDHGIGIAPEERERIFEHFYRSRQAIAQQIKGSGIGLYLARAIVELHGGRIWADHARHGGPGTSLHVWLPQQIDAASDA
ncbi:ATP-binding protein [Kallotenue papyrolyticum]|uniref:sensor histidine kinase n=1 Tax=Kallotenue papyrolyticum TaxID=1325125 RepID=UPI0004785C0E|nr:ATP-binding protein [Kallotenue papyrolyticum]